MLGGEETGQNTSSVRDGLFWEWEYLEKDVEMGYIPLSNIQKRRVDRKPDDSCSHHADASLIVEEKRILPDSWDISSPYDR